MKPELVLEKNAHAWQLFHQTKKTFPFLWHYHDECELFVPLGGQWKYLIGNLQGDMEPGEAFFLPPRISHSFFTLANQKTAEPHCYVLFFCLPLIAVDQMVGHDVTSVLQNRFRGGAKLSNITTLRASLKNMTHQEAGLREATAFLEVLDILLHAQKVTRIAQSPLSDSETLQTSEAVSRIGDYLARHWQEPLTLATIAQATHLTVPTMCRVFRRSTGHSVFEYLRKLRISHVQWQLVWSDRPITEIAWDCGYQTLGHFYRSFHEATGVSPRAYRLSMRKGIQQTNPQSIGLQTPDHSLEK